MIYLQSIKLISNDIILCIFFYNSGNYCPGKRRRGAEESAKAGSPPVAEEKGEN